MIRSTSNIIAAPPPAAGEVNQLAALMGDPESITFKAIMNPGDVLDPGVVNGRAWRGMELPSANGHATARSIAKAYAALARGGEIDGYRVLTPASIERCYTEQSFGIDEVIKQ